jgi:hypothetical protein
MKNLIKFIKEAHLIELDLSWNQMSATNLADFFSAIEDNHSIQSLNLGWINMNSIEERS